MLPWARRHASLRLSGRLAFLKCPNRRPRHFVPGYYQPVPSGQKPLTHLAPRIKLALMGARPLSRPGLARHKGRGSPLQLVGTRSRAIRASASREATKRERRQLMERAAVPKEQGLARTSKKMRRDMQRRMRWSASLPAVLSLLRCIRIAAYYLTQGFIRSKIVDGRGPSDLLLKSAKSAESAVSTSGFRFNRPQFL